MAACFALASACAVSMALLLAVGVLEPLSAMLLPRFPAGEPSGEDGGVPPWTWVCCTSLWFIFGVTESNRASHCLSLSSRRLVRLVAGLALFLSLSDVRPGVVV